MQHTTAFLSHIHQHVLTITFNQPECHNAFNAECIAELTETLRQVEHDDVIRCILFKANGKHFSAGGDLRWMQDMANRPLEENIEDALGLAQLLQTLNNLQKPTLAITHGKAMGGGVGLLACCDIVIAVAGAEFCFSEVKLGLIPATISPFVVHKIGASAARRYFLTAEMMSSQRAEQLGLIQECCESEHDAEQLAKHLSQLLLQNGPSAIASAKRLIQKLHPFDNDLAQWTSELLAKTRCSEEAKIGIQAFLTKQKPNWS